LFPSARISGVKSRFNEAVDKFIASLEITADERDKALLEVQLGNLKNDPDADRQAVSEGNRRSGSAITKVEK